MKWTSVLLMALLALGISSLRSKKIMLVEDKPTDLIAPKPSIRSPLSHLKKGSSTIPTSLGTTATMKKFNTFFSTVIAEKKEKLWRELTNGGSNNPYLLYLMKRGVVSFSTFSHMDVDEGIGYSDRELYLEHLAARIGLNKNERNSFIEEALKASTRENQDVKEISLIKSEEDGSALYSMVLVAFDENSDSIDYMVIHQGTSFKSYPKVFVVTTEDADSFGDYPWRESTSDERFNPWPPKTSNKAPAPEVSPEVDLKVIHKVLNFMKIAAIEKFKEYLH